MLALKIIGTVFIGISCITTFVKNILAFRDGKTETFYTKTIIGATLYGWLWRAFVIVALWVTL